LLEFTQGGTPAEPRDAATIVLVRARGAGTVASKAAGGEQHARDPIEIFCVERHKASRFMGGALVFPGGKLDAADADEAWTPLTEPPVRPATGPHRGSIPFATTDAHLRSLAIAAARETLEEAAMLHVAGGSVTQNEVLALRTELQAAPDALRAFLAKRGLKLDLGALYPLSRWITPEAEARRYDTRFFLAVAPSDQAGAHDERETTSSFWASPREILRRFEAAEVQLMPPTHRTVSLLSGCADIAAVLRFVASGNLDPLCPRLVRHVDERGETMALTLPGDPEHEVTDKRIVGPSRYVLRGEQWHAEDAPQ
jgi:8-oxo-dGTP pyrophosphatase MutT (NUDIX family)